MFGYWSNPSRKHFNLGSHRILVTAFALWLATNPPPSALAEQNSVESPEDLFTPKQHVASDGDILNYRMLSPKQISEGTLYPLIVFLHGAGERGSDNLAQLKHGVKELCTPERREKFACFVIAPQCPPGQRWADIDWTQQEIRVPSDISRSLELTFEVVDQLAETAPIDRSRIYITGLSMGGYGTWDAIYRRPDFFAAAMPICGGGDPATASVILNVPIACFHGEQDKVVVPEKSRRIVQKLRDLGAAPIYVEYPGVGHDSWTPTYANEENWEWMFKQKRSQDPK